MSITSIRPAKRIPTFKKYFIYLIVAGVIFSVLFFNQERIPEILGIAKKAKISVISEEGSKVYLDNKFLGNAPVDSVTVKAGLGTLSIKGSKNSYTTSLNLVDKSENIIYRDLGINKALSSGINIWEGTLDDRKVELYMFPEYSKIVVNDKEATIDEISALESGEYKFKISADGFKETTFTVNVRKEFKTNIEVKLAPLPNSKDVSYFGGYENIFTIYSNNSDVFYNSKDWVDYFLYFYTKRNLEVTGFEPTKQRFFDYFVDYEGRIYNSSGNQIDTLDTIEAPYTRRIGLLLRSADKGKINERNFKSLLFFNPKVDLNSDSLSDSQNFSAKFATLTENKISLTDKLTKPAAVLGTSIPANSLPNPQINLKKVVIDNEWLRVRKDPGGVEIGQAKQGEEFDYLGEVAEGWVKIQFKPGVIGYVSKQLVKLK